MSCLKFHEGWLTCGDWRMFRWSHMTPQVDQLRPYLSANAVATVRNSRPAIRRAVARGALALNRHSRFDLTVGRRESAKLNRLIAPESLCDVSLPNEPVDPRTRKTCPLQGFLSRPLGELCEDHCNNVRRLASLG